MSLQTLTFIVVGATFALYIGIAIWAKASTTGEFYVAGKGIHPVANGMATAADWMSAASFISMAGLIAFLGYGGAVFLMGWTCSWRPTCASSASSRCPSSSATATTHRPRASWRSSA